MTQDIKILTAGKKSGGLFYAATLATFYAASSVPTPLYHLYQAAFGFTPVLTTVIFAVYSFSLLASLLVVGSISDHLGRRPTIFAALVILALSILLFLHAQSPAWLIAARFVQGIAVGTAASAVGAALLDVDPHHGAAINSIAPLYGMALGAVATGFLVQFAPYPMHLSQLAVLVPVIVAAVGIWTVPETSETRPGVLRSLTPKIFVPTQAREAFLTITPLNIAVWALAGFYLSLVPSLVKEAVGSSSPLVGGVVVGALTTGGAIAATWLRWRGVKSALRIGPPMMIIGALLVVAGTHIGNALVLMAATLIAGIGFGASFLGAARSLMLKALPKERAGLMAAFYIECYLASSLTAIGAGFLVGAKGFVLTTDVYCAVIVLLTLFAAIRLRAKASGS
jgi:predicted MFS family arabinose efflux permease